MKVLENIVEIGENGVKQHCLLFHNVFYSSQPKFQFLSRYDSVICKCFEFDQGQNFVVWHYTPIQTNKNYNVSIIWYRVHPLPNSRILDYSNLEGFADKKIIVI